MQVETISPKQFSHVKIIAWIFSLLWIIKVPYNTSWPCAVFYIWYSQGLERRPGAQALRTSLPLLCALCLSVKKGKKGLFLLPFIKSKRQWNLITITTNTAMRGFFVDAESTRMEKEVPLQMPEAWRGQKAAQLNPTLCFLWHCFNTFILSHALSSAAILVWQINDHRDKRPSNHL